MPRMVLQVVAALVLTLLAAVAVPVPVACACSCAVVDTDEAMANASAVFDGTVVAASLPTGGSSGDLIAYTIEVTRVYRGSVPASVVVRSAVSEASCGVELAGRVTVFAHGPVDALETTLCSAPLPLDRSRLGTGRPPEAAATTSPEQSPTPSPPPATPAPFLTSPPLLGGLLGAGVLAGVATWVVRRRRS